MHRSTPALMVLAPPSSRETVAWLSFRVGEDRSYSPCWNAGYIGGRGFHCVSLSDRRFVRSAAGQ
jgi:hypothetical protein